MAWSPIIDHTTLKAAIASWLNRTDLTDVIDQFILNATRVLRRDERVKELKYSALSITADALAYPSGFGGEIESLYHDGPTYFGEIESVSPDQLGGLKAVYGQTGVPQFVSPVGGDLKFYFAPEPDATYAAVLTYWVTGAGLVDLVSTTTKNWVIDDHPDIYLYATLVEAGPYLRDEQQRQVVRDELERRIVALGKQVSRQQFSGTMTRSFTPIG